MVRFFLLDEMTCLSDLTGLWFCFTHFILLPLQKKPWGTERLNGVKWKWNTSPAHRSARSSVRPRPVPRSLTTTRTHTPSPGLRIVFINFGGIIVAIGERLLQRGVNRHWKTWLVSPETSIWQTLCREKTHEFFAKVQVNGAGASKGNGQPQSTFYPRSLVSWGALEQQSDLLVSRELCLGQKSEEGSVPWLKGRGQKSWRNGLIEKGL